MLLLAFEGFDALFVPVDPARLKDIPGNQEGERQHQYEKDNQSR